MQKEFVIFKEGVTEKPITIVSMKGMSANGKAFNKCEKIEFYKSLGYTVTSVI
jgi:hypothetical protein